MCYAYSCRKARRKPLHEMLSMKLPAETFSRTRKARTKETGNCLFASRVWGKRPILTTESWQSFPLGIGRQPPIIWHEVTNVYWSYPSGKKQPPKRDIISVKFQGVLAMQNTISIHVGNTSSIIHNNRKTENHTNPDIDVSRSGDNITLVQENIKDSYEKLFGQAVDEYNGKQKRADRKINNYLQKVKDST